MKFLILSIFILFSFNCLYQLNHVTTNDDTEPNWTEVKPEVKPTDKKK